MLRDAAPSRSRSLSLSLSSRRVGYRPAAAITASKALDNEERKGENLLEQWTDADARSLSDLAIFASHSSNGCVVT